MTSRLPLAALLVLLGGCASESTWNMEGAQPQPAPLVDVSGQAQLLGESSAALSPAQLLERLDADLVLRREDEARDRITRYPDVVQAALRGHALTPSPTRPSASLLFAAKVHAEQGGGPWPTFLAARLRQPEPYVSFAAERATLLSAPADEERELSVPASARRDLLLELEALRVQAERARRAGERARAAALLERARERARQQALYMAAGFALDVADLRLADEARAIPAWTRAAELGLALFAGPAAPADPAWWSRLLELRREGAAWPAGAAAALAPQAWPAAPAGEARREPTDALVWTLIGRWRAVRKEHKQALLALREAQERTRASWARAHLQLLQARALLALEQPAPASALLMGLADSREPGASQASVALLGTLRLRNGQLRRGFGLLRQAVEEGTVAVWPYQAEAEADLGLAYLAMGNEERGLHYLHVAQRRFQREGQLPALRHCLKNELRYLDYQGHDQQAEEVRARCLRLGVEQH